MRPTERAYRLAAWVGMTAFVCGFWALANIVVAVVGGGHG